MLLNRHVSILCCAWHLFSQFCLIAQVNRLDSLFSELKTAKDTPKVKVLNILEKGYKNSDNDIAFQYSNEALVLSEKLDFHFSAF